jgi:hypothetical protein
VEKGQLLDDKGLSQLVLATTLQLRCTVARALGVTPNLGVTPYMV